MSENTETHGNSSESGTAPRGLQAYVREVRSSGRPGSPSRLGAFGSRRSLRPDVCGLDRTGQDGHAGSWDGRSAVDDGALNATTASRSHPLRRIQRFSREVDANRDAIMAPDQSGLRWDTVALDAWAHVSGFILRRDGGSVEVEGAQPGLEGEPSRFRWSELQVMQLVRRFVAAQDAAGPETIGKWGRKSAHATDVEDEHALEYPFCSDSHSEHPCNLDPIDLQNILSIAEQHFDNMQFDEAIPLLLRYCQADKHNAECLWRLGASYYQKRDYQTSKIYLHEAVRIDSEHARARYFLGSCYHRDKDYMTAIEHLGMSAAFAEYDVETKNAANAKLQHIYEQTREVPLLIKRPIFRNYGLALCFIGLSAAIISYIVSFFEAQAAYQATIIWAAACISCICVDIRTTTLIWHNNRWVMSYGFLWGSDIDINHVKIKNLHVHQSPLDRLLGVSRIRGQFDEELPIYHRLGRYKMQNKFELPAIAGKKETKRLCRFWWSVALHQKISIRPPKSSTPMDD